MPIRFVALLLAGLSAGAALAGPMPKVGLKLLPETEAINPGGSVTLAIEINIQPGWHIYHPIILETGAPTTLKFTTLPGTTFGPVRFPQPELREVTDIEYLGYGDKVRLLCDVQAPTSAKPGEELPLAVTANLFVCEDQGTCVEVVKSARATLKIAAERGPLNEKETFEEARRDVAPLLNEAPYLKGSSVEIKPDSVGLKKPAEILFNLKIEPKHHMQDRSVTIEGLVPARLFIEAVDGLKFGEPVWPPASEREVEGLGRVRELGGNVQVRVPFTIEDEKFTSGPVPIRAMLQYQVCTDDGMCFPPVMAESFVSFTAETPEKPAGNRGTVQPAVKYAGANEIAAISEDGGSGDSSASATIAGKGPPSFLWILLVALAGGVILNVMPCVLPVISLKIFNFVQQAHDARGRVFLLGVIYSLGVVASFAVLAVLVVGFKQAWGGVLQSPPFIIGLTAVVFAFGLSMLGVFEFRLPGTLEGAAGEAGSREGVGGAFLSGLLTTALATPCLAPALGTALGAVLQLPAAQGATVIMTIGLGLAAPYLLLSAFPQWLRFLPKPGPWMVTFKEITGFIMLAVVVWLFWILIDLVDSALLIAALAFLGFVALACWLLGRISLSDTRLRTFTHWGMALIFLAAGASLSFQWLANQRWSSGTPVDLANVRPAAPGEPIEWQRWEPGLPEALSERGYTVYVDFTAKWCVTCQTNKVILHLSEIESQLQNGRLVMLKADFTKHDPAIQQELKKYNRAGVPLNLIVPAYKPNDVIVLPEILTPGVVANALRQAGPSVAELRTAQAATLK